MMFGWHEVMLWSRIMVGDDVWMTCGYVMSPRWRVGGWCLDDMRLCYGPGLWLEMMFGWHEVMLWARIMVWGWRLDDMGLLYVMSPNYGWEWCLDDMRLCYESQIMVYRRWCLDGMGLLWLWSRMDGWEMIFGWHEVCYESGLWFGMMFGWHEVMLWARIMARDDVWMTWGYHMLWARNMGGVMFGWHDVWMMMFRLCYEPELWVGMMFGWHEVMLWARIMVGDDVWMTWGYVMGPDYSWEWCLDDMRLCYGPGLWLWMMFGWHEVMLWARIIVGNDVWMTWGYYMLWARIMVVDDVWMTWGYVMSPNYGWGWCLDDMRLCYEPGLWLGMTFGWHGVIICYEPELWVGMIFGWHEVMLWVRIMVGDDVWMTWGYVYVFLSPEIMGRRWCLDDMGLCYGPRWRVGGWCLDDMRLLYVMSPNYGWGWCLDDMRLCYGPGLWLGMMFGWHEVMLWSQMEDRNDVWMTWGYVMGPDGGYIGDDVWMTWGYVMGPDYGWEMMFGWHEVMLWARDYGWEMMFGWHEVMLWARIMGGDDVWMTWGYVMSPDYGRGWCLDDMGLLYVMSPDYGWEWCLDDMRLCYEPELWVLWSWSRIMVGNDVWMTWGYV